MQRYRISIVFVAGLLGLLLVGLLATAGNSSRAEEQEALLQMPDFPPTPTIAPAPASGPATAGASTIFADSFDSDASLKQWQMVDRGEVLPDEASVWRIEDGRLLQDRTAKAYNPDFRETLMLAGDPSLSNYTVTAKVYDQSNATFGIIARHQGDSFYRFRINANATEGNRKQVLEKVVDGVATDLAVVESPGYEHRRWYTVSMQVSGSQIRVYIDGVLALEANDSTLASGQFGVSTIAFGAIVFDDVTVTTP